MLPSQLQKYLDKMPKFARATIYSKIKDINFKARMKANFSYIFYINLLGRFSFLKKSMCTK